MNLFHHMRRRALVLPVLGLMLAASTMVVSGSDPDPMATLGDLDAYTVTVDRHGLFELQAEGHDFLALTELEDGSFEAALALTREGRDALVARDVAPALVRLDNGLSVAQDADRILQEGGYTVYRPYDGEGNIEWEIRQLAADNPGHVKLVEIGRTHQDRPILALKVTADANETPDGSRPATFYNALQHAREWIAIETNRRLARYFIEGFGEDEMITDLLGEIELWFVIVANPDGYELTFTEGRRLWRKNVADNNGNGTFDADADGVDPNRNFNGHWGYDNQGSSPNMGSETYRGPAPNSEPMTQATVNLLQSVEFSFLINYHSAAELLLYPEGWQDKTETADHTIFTSLAGDRANPAVEGFAPMLSSGLYITNGETCDYAHAAHDVLCYTPELSTPPGGGNGFLYPDDEALIQEEFLRNLPFALDIALSTADPTEPDSHLGNTIEPMYVDDFAVSYGDPQPVQATIMRKLGDAEIVWRIGDGPEMRGPTAEWEGGERYGASGDVYYRRVRGTVQGATPGDEVTVWFEADGESTEPFTYTLHSDSGANILVLAQEDYTGVAPEYPSKDGPAYLDYYTDPLTVAEYAYDVYDVDAHGRVAPSPLGVLGHYELVIWYSGDDEHPMAVERAENQVDTLALDMMLTVRDHMNEGGKLWWTGKHLGLPYWLGRRYDPAGEGICGEDGVFCEGLQNDFLQYYLGAFNSSAGPALGEDVTVVGTGAPFEGVTFTFGDPGAGNQDASRLFGVTSDSMPVEQFPHFASAGVSAIDHPGMRPHTGDSWLYSGEVAYEFQRAMRTVDVPADGETTLNLWVNRLTRSPFDAFFIETAPVVTDTATITPTWTTLPDVNGHTSQEAALSCWSPRWFGLSPQFAHYMTPTVDAEDEPACEPVGTTGEWHAATGSSNGWEEWTIDLSGYAGQSIYLSMSHFSSAQAFPGVFVDDVSLSTGESTSFEGGDLGGWEMSGLPVDGEEHEDDWYVAGEEVYPESNGPIVTTEDSIIFGFGFEGIEGPEQRMDVLMRILDYFGIEAVPPAVDEPIIYLPLARKNG